MRISDWSSDVCSSDLFDLRQLDILAQSGFLAMDQRRQQGRRAETRRDRIRIGPLRRRRRPVGPARQAMQTSQSLALGTIAGMPTPRPVTSVQRRAQHNHPRIYFRSEEQTSELQSLMRISYAVFCLKKKTNNNT